MKTRRCLLAVLGLCLELLLATLLVHAQEEILSFASDLSVHPDSSVTVVERIRVRAEGQQIRHGIVRDVPLRYWDYLQPQHRILATVLAVERDGRPELFSVRRLRNLVRIRIGDPAATLTNGEHEYQITYRVAYAFSFFSRYDRLCWNVTGESWPFAVGEASATVHLPAGVPSNQIETEAFSGAFRPGKANATALISPTGEIVFRAHQPLASGEGLFVQVSVPKGCVQPPQWSWSSWSKARDLGGQWAAVALGLLLVYLGLVRLVLGPRNVRTCPALRTEPPPGLSPPVSRFVRGLGYDDKCLAAALVNLAVNGLIRIKELKPGCFQILNQFAVWEGKVSLAEAALYSDLLGSASCITLRSFNGVAIQQAKKRFQKALRQECVGTYLSPKLGWMIPALVLALLGTGVVVVRSVLPEAALLAVLMTGALGAGVRLPFPGAWKSMVSWDWIWRAGLLGAVLAALFAMATLSDSGQPLMSPMAFLSVLGLAFFAREAYDRFPRLTPAGQALVGEVEGLGMFLMGSPNTGCADISSEGISVERFEALLPFAFALDAEEAWAARYRCSMAADATTQTALKRQSRWYTAAFSRDPAALLARVRTFAGALSLAVATSAVEPPARADDPNSLGDSSGDSGGDVGGGGGGGW